MTPRLRKSVASALFLTFGVVLASAQTTAPIASPESAISTRISGLRSVADADRPKATKDIALAIRELPPSPTKVNQAMSLAFLSTEGDFGRDTLQAVAETLIATLREQPSLPAELQDAAYSQLALYARYEGVRVNLNEPRYRAAMAKVEENEKARAAADFTLTDLEGKHWTRSALKGKVVLVNFWATWCPPCRKEMPDLQALYDRFKSQGLVVLAISDEDVSKVRPFIAEKGYTFPVLLDPGRKVNEMYKMGGIPNSYIYDRNGKLVAQSIDMRTQKQFLGLLAKAGLK